MQFFPQLCGMTDANFGKGMPFLLLVIYLIIFLGKMSHFEANSPNT